MRAYILAEAVAAEGIFEWEGGGQTNLLGPMNRRGPLWETRGPYLFLTCPVSTSGIFYILIKLKNGHYQHNA